jgi:CRP-like cAMP-binding protein
LLRGKTEWASLGELTRGDAFGELGLLVGAPRAATATATYAGATVLRLASVAIAPIIRNVRSFAVTASVVMAASGMREGRARARARAGEGEGEGDEEGDDERARETEIASRAERVAASIAAWSSSSAFRRGRRKKEKDGGGRGAEGADGGVHASSSDSSSSSDVFPEKLSDGLRFHPYFTGLTTEEKRFVKSRCRARRVDVGRAIFTQGEPGEKVFIVLEGSAIVYRESGEGAARTRTRVAELSPGQTAGENSSWRGRPHRVTAVASGGGCVVVEVEAATIREVVEKRPMLKDVVDDLMTFFAEQRR